MYRRKDKMVSVRLSADDHDAFQKASENSGAASISEFARMAMRRWIDQGDDISHHDDMRRLQGRLVFLAAEVERLDRLVAGHSAEKLPARTPEATVSDD
jgi:hypothetical protein